MTLGYIGISRSSFCYLLTGKSHKHQLGSNLSSSSMDMQSVVHWLSLGRLGMVQFLNNTAVYSYILKMRDKLEQFKELAHNHLDKTLVKSLLYFLVVHVLGRTWV